MTDTTKGQDTTAPVESASRGGAGSDGRPLEHYCDRIRELTRVMEGAAAERDLAMYRAWQRGMPPEQVARLASEEPDEVRRTVTVLDREEDIDEWGEGPTWIKFYRKTW
ncbi:MAG: hypothetical protein GEU94_02320 [Micromonosporaceae bacterium]|nr:hypothetical protein [Micromonosporaceae bacterium]